MSVGNLTRSTPALWTASVCPRLTARTRKLIAPRVPPYRVISEIAARHNLHIRTKGKLGNRMFIWALLGGPYFCNGLTESFPAPILHCLSTLRYPS